MIYEGNFLNSLNRRQLDYDSRSCFKKNIIKSFYESCNYLFKAELNLPDNHTPGIKDIEFSKDKNFLVSASSRGSLILSLNENSIFSTKIKEIKLDHDCEINKIALTYDSIKLINAGKDSNYFSKNHITINDTTTCEIIEKKNFDFSITDISSSPINSNIFTIANGQPNFYLYDLRNSNLQLFDIDIKQLKLCYNFVKYHPLKDHLLLICTKYKSGVYVFDLRNRQFVFNYNVLNNKGEDSVFAKYNSHGNQIIVTRKYLSPLLFNEDEKYPILEFDSFGYHNFTGKKSCCFAGSDDEYVVVGSDNHDVYMWEIPKNIGKTNFKNLFPKKISEAKFILKGHKGIAKGVCYNYQKSIIASCGLDETIILWSPFSFCLESEIEKICLSNETTHERYISYIYIDSINNSLIPFLRLFFSNSVNTLTEDTEVINYLLNIQKKLYCNELSLLLPKNIYEVDFKYIENHTKKNFNLNFIKLFIHNYNKNDIVKESKILEKIKTILGDENENGNLHIRHVSLLFEIKKVFQTKILIQNCIEYLSKVFKKINIENKQNSIEAKIQMNELLIDLIKIFKNNKGLYENSFKLMKKLLSKFDSINSLDKFKSKYVNVKFKEINFLKNCASEKIKNIKIKDKKKE